MAWYISLCPVLPFNALLYAFVHLRFQKENQSLGSDLAKANIVGVAQLAGSLESAVDLGRVVYRGERLQTEYINPNIPRMASRCQICTVLGGPVPFPLHLAVII